jgi:hypothetical protein
MVSYRLSIVPSTVRESRFPNAVTLSPSDTVAALSSGIESPTDLGPEDGAGVAIVGENDVGIAVLTVGFPIDRDG